MKTPISNLGNLCFALLTLSVIFSSDTVHAKKLYVLFLGDNGHHRPHDRFLQLEPVLKERGIKLVYTDKMNDVNSENLNKYDALLVYANIDKIDPLQEKALLEYVSSGKGFVPLHCASYCFRNSKEIVALMGGQFKRHGTGTFRTEIAEADHPIMKGFGGFESWDETYVHHLHNEKDRTVLEYRVDNDGREPWTWVRTHGNENGDGKQKGRVFYTAWGHDQRTWGNPGFQNLVERGIRWAANDDPSQAGNFLANQPFPVPNMNQPRKDVKPFEYIDVGAKIPNYVRGKKWGEQGELQSKMQKPLPVEESLKHLVVPEGFHVELFASEPSIAGKPICMNWDERGRLWVAETYDYPNELQPPGKGRDRIRILEDTDHDGRADKFTVFAEKLSIPTSITFHRGGIILQDGTETLYLKDTNDDGVADEKRKLFSGWNQGDTHGGVSNFQYGLDNWIWGMQGYNHSQPKSPVEGNANDSKQAFRPAFRQGFFRFRPDGSELEFIRSTNNNTWGLGISEEGIIFGSTANRNPSVYMPIPNRYYERVNGWKSSLVLGSMADTHLFKPITDKVRQVDQQGGYTAAAGHALYTARVYPQEYWNRTAFVNGPTGHLTGTFVIDAEGSDFKSKYSFNLLASDDEWTAPIMSEVGPDGNLWVIDWYNYIIQHNPTPKGFKTGKGNAYETDLRDKKHGRIYRVVYDGKQTEEKAEYKPLDLSIASLQLLVDTLKHPTMLWRKHAQRLLVERGKTDVVPALLKVVSDPSVDGIGLNTGAIHALWTLQGLGVIDGSNEQVIIAVVAALQHPSAGVRRNALQVLPKKEQATEAVLSNNLLLDAHPQVRLAAFLALADLPSVKNSGEAILVAMQHPSNTNDRWIKDAAISAAASHSDGFLQALAKLKKSPVSHTNEVAAIVSEHYARSFSGNAKTVDSLPALISNLRNAEPNVAATIIAGLSSGWPKEVKVTSTKELETDLGELFKRLPLNGRGQLINLTSRWGNASLDKYFRDITHSQLAELDNSKLSVEQRIAAANQLVEFQPNDKTIVSEFLNRITPQTSPVLAQGLMNALRKSQSPDLGETLIARFPGFTPQTRMAGISVLLQRKESTLALLDAISNRKIQLADLSLDQQQSLSAHPDQTIRKHAKAILKSGGALPNADRLAVLESLLPLTKQSGDAKHGKEVFKKQCAKCHKHSGEGNLIGPDLTGMAVHPKEELLKHIIDPSSSVEGNYRVYSVMTSEGKVLNGLLASESRTAIEIIDVEGKKQSVLREEIEEIAASQKSLMPEGFEKQVKPEEIRDLLEFLTQRGKFLPLDLSKVATIASDRGMFFDKAAQQERLIFSDWKPKTFKGVPFQLGDPKNGTVSNVVLLHGPSGAVSNQMPKSVELPCNGPVRMIHLLSGVGGWAYPYSNEKTVSMIVRLHYADGKTEDHELKNAVHFADYIRRVDVPESEFAFQLRGQQIRYLNIQPKRTETIKHLELIKGPDSTAPVVMAVTLESP